MSKQSTVCLNDDGLILSGYHKKLKTMKKKFFVLYKDTICGAARLEYYDNEKKFKSGITPKRVIKLKNCFNINRRLDTKYDYVIALSTKDGGFGIVLETEKEMLRWLEVFISLQRCDSQTSGSFRPYFDHVWQVEVQKKGLAVENGIFGNYHVCLSSKSVTFIRIGPEKTTSGDSRVYNIEFLLTTIRRCGDSQCYFYMEVGRQSIIGAGELWMETEESLIAQNIHGMILNAMSAKSDTFLEPMRKRSSSANEASKPINVSHRRQTQTECKINNSPQTIIGFGRERCDSLPSRNRTSSECSTTSTSIRTNVMPGIRGHLYQRSSNSPPLTTNAGCSESEESSISIDEPDENGSFLPYRFNSSEGVIPEENTDELVNSENNSDDLYKINNDVNLRNPIQSANSEENYISMAPVKFLKDNEEDKLNSLKQVGTTDNPKYFACVGTPTSGSTKSDIEFTEYTSDNVSKNLNYEIDSEAHRPARAYSIGNKVELNKIYKRIGNSNDTDQSTIRVRAFSVGSRAKIPRCDLQRGAMYPKSTAEKNYNSNNNICSISDTSSFRQMLHLNAACQEKKSTSAPLLINKSHNSVDRMSDLMEIDFSKSSNNTNNRIYQTKTHFSRSVPTTTQIRNDQIRDYDNCSTVPAVNTVFHTDNGYLEMKPIGISSSNNSTSFKKLDNEHTSCEHLTNTQQLTGCSEVPVTGTTGTSQLLANKNETLPKKSSHLNSVSICRFTDPISIPQRKPEQEFTGTSCFSSTALKKPIVKSNKHSCGTEDQNYSNIEQSSDATITQNISSKYAQLTLSSIPKQKSKKNDNSILSKEIGFDNCRKNVIKSVSYLKKKKLQNNNILANSVENKKYTPSSSDKNPTECNTSDYDAKQMKKSLTSCNSGLIITNCSKPLAATAAYFNPSISPNRSVQKEQCQQVRPRSTNSPSPILSSLPSSLCGCTSSSTSCLNYLQQTDTLKNKKEFNSFSNCGTKNAEISRGDLNILPKPLDTEPELYYASLDLPQCSTSSNNSAANVSESPQSVIPVVTCANVNNSYAKIDFDHSDSSSSSSKNLNI